jgi:hypothetical protein
VGLQCAYAILGFGDNGSIFGTGTLAALLASATLVTELFPAIGRRKSTLAQTT